MKVLVVGLIPPLTESWMSSLMVFLTAVFALTIGCREKPGYRSETDDKNVENERSKAMKIDAVETADTVDTVEKVDTSLEKGGVPGRKEGCRTARINGLIDLHDIPGLRFDIVYATSRNFTGEPLPGYEAPGAMLRKEAADALGRVVEKLKEKKLSLVVFDAYRPVRASRAMVEWARRTGREDLLENKYISAVSTHNRGTAVDVSLVDLETGEPLFMGSDFDDFSSGSHTRNAKGEALENRMLLRDVMRAEGFRAISKEWWHFSYDVEGVRSMDVPYKCACPLISR